MKDDSRVDDLRLASDRLGLAEEDHLPRNVFKARCPLQNRRPLHGCHALRRNPGKHARALHEARRHAVHRNRRRQRHRQANG
jgi:hypothetical protein